VTATRVTVTTTTGNLGRVARPKLTRRAGAFGMALTAWDVWRRLPPRQRRWVYKQVRVHGVRVAKQAYTAQKTHRKK
jgi:hypothetical protein